jgi:hypothetical protein
MTESASQRRARLAGIALREAEGSTRCQHIPENRSIDEGTGRPWCGDCGAFTDGGPQWDPSWGPAPSDGFTPDRRAAGQ